MSKRSGTQIRTKIYRKFRGVDFTTDPSLVDDSRSPWATNIVADEGGMPEKRVGYRTVKELGDDIYGLYSAEFDGVKHLLAHSGTKLYRWYEDSTASAELSTAFPESKSVAVYMNDKLWIFTGNGLFVYNGTTCTRADADAYVPITVIGRTPSGGGEAYEGINYLTGKQEIRAMGDGTSVEYTLPYAPVDSVNKVVVDDVEKTLTTDYTVDLQNGKVTFTTAPGEPEVSGQDNVYITFTHNTEGYADHINKCTIATVWGIGGTSDRIVASGNPDYPNHDFICGYNDGTYWSDKDYSVVGTSETKIMGYRRINDQLAIIKEDNGQDSTVFMRSGELDSDGEAVFTIKSALGGAGAVSKYCFGNIGNEQLYLTGNGVYAITTNSLTAEKIVQNRSKRVDPQMVKEDLSSAISVVYKDKFMIFVDGKVYGLDGTQDKSYGGKSAYEYLYECFYWEGIPATAVMKVADSGEESLYFGTEDGNVCKFNYDIDGMSKFSDDGEAITAVWATPADDDGDPLVYKFLLKKGNGVTIKPYSRSSAKIYLRTDKDASGWYANGSNMDIFDWEDIDFDRFTFNSNDGPAEIPINRKVKNYKRLQIIVMNDQLNEGFGVYAITKHYVTGNFAKR